MILISATLTHFVNLFDNNVLYFCVEMQKINIHLLNLTMPVCYRVLEYYPSRDSDGAVIRPLPRAQRLLSDATCLPHIVQVMNIHQHLL